MLGYFLCLDLCFALLGLFCVSMDYCTCTYKLSLMEVVFGQGSSVDLTKTLHLLCPLGMMNSTMDPKWSSTKDSVALEYSPSAMALADSLPCLKLW